MRDGERDGVRDGERDGERCPNLPDCTQRLSYLLTERSNKWTLPSAVTAAKTVEENGDQATSPTTLFRS